MLDLYHSQVYSLTFFVRMLGVLCDGNHMVPKLVRFHINPSEAAQGARDQLLTANGKRVEPLLHPCSTFS